MLFIVTIITNIAISSLKCVIFLPNYKLFEIKLNV